MWKAITILLFFYGYSCASPLGGFKRNMPVLQQREDGPMIMEPSTSQELDVEKPAADVTMISTLTLPSNATSIRGDITDGFSCANRVYGYYADIENECQIFHVCLPVTYADGKENTFRWSFICPEETVFSQDSFTCMRREDMNIDCEDSDKYYELNRNFGMLDAESNKNNDNNMPSMENADEPPEMNSQVMQQQAADMPLVVAAASSTDARPQLAPPLKEKPMKVQKPNRRKPASGNKPQTKPVALFPLRKMPQSSVSVSQTSKPVPLQSLEPVKADKEDIEGPIEQKFPRRPVINITTLKETAKPEKTPSRVNSYNHRKRPGYANKPVAEPVIAVDVSQPDGHEVPQSALNSEKPSVQALIIAPIDKGSDLTDHSQLNTDAESQASEIAAVIVQPEKAIPTQIVESGSVENVESEVTGMSVTNKNEPENEPIPEESSKVKLPQAPIEAFEEIPAVIAEIEEVQPAAEIIQPDADTPASTNPANTDELLMGVDLPKDTQSSEKLEILGAPAIFEENSEEAVATAPNAPTSINTDSEQQSAMIAVTPEGTEELKHTAGGFKPVDASMAAEAEALITDFLHTLMKSESTNAKPIMPTDMAAETQATVANNQETTSSADEMEKQGQKDETEASKVEVSNNEFDVGDDLKNQATSVEPAVNVSNEEKNSKLEQTLKLNIAEQPQIVLDQYKEEGTAASSVAEAVSHHVPDNDVTSDAEVEPVAESQSLKNKEYFPNMLMTNSFPASMYQIPVKVIQTPIEELEAVEKTNEKTDQKADIEQPTIEPEDSIAAYKPISIDDIVELVKERLDQMPEKSGPIELIMQPVDKDNIPINTGIEEMTDTEISKDEVHAIDNMPIGNGLKEEKPLDEILSTIPKAEKPLESESEEIIMPIYKRVTDTNDNIIKTQHTEVVETNKVDKKPMKSQSVSSAQTADKDTQTADSELMPAITKTDVDNSFEKPTEPSEALNAKSSRSYRSRNIKNTRMDPRKRRFLFRSDVS